MADEQLIKPRELPAATTVFADDAIMTDNGAIVGKATPVQIVNAGAPVPTEAEAIAGTDNSKRMTPLTVKQVLDSVTAPSVLRAQAWAESDSPPNPGIPGSKSAKSWAAEAKSTAEIMEKASQQDQYSLTLSSGQTVIDEDADGNPIVVTDVADVYVDGFLLSPGVDYDINGSGHPVLLQEWDAGKVVRVNLIPNYSSPTSKSTATPPSASLRAFAAEPYDSVAAVLSSKQITPALAGNHVFTKSGRAGVIGAVAEGSYSQQASGGGWFTPTSYGLVPEDFGALGDGEADDTAALAKFWEYHVETDRRVAALREGARYLCTGITIPDGFVLQGNRATMVRLTNTANPHVVVGKRAIVSHLFQDGQVGVLGATGATARTCGIAADDYAKVLYCDARSNFRHGITNRPVSDQLEYYGIQVIGCHSQDNGINFDPAGTGGADGIAFVNVHNGLMRDCTAYHSARSAFTATTYDTSTTETDPDLSVGCVIDNCIDLGGHGYVHAEINMEAVTSGKVINCANPKSGITFRKSPKMQVKNVEATRIGGTDADFPIVDGFVISDETRSHERLYLTGNTPRVSNGRVVSPTVTSGYVVYVVAPDRGGSVRDVEVVGGQNGFRIDVASYSGLSVSGVSNLQITDGPSGGVISFSQNNAPQKNTGRRVCYLDVAPTTGTWAIGDQIWRRAYSSALPIGWVVKTPGGPGVFELQDLS